MKDCDIESLANAARVDGIHAIVRATVLVTLDGVQAALPRFHQLIDTFTIEHAATTQAPQPTRTTFTLEQVTATQN